jgi:transposase
VGITSLIATSNGDKITNPKHFKKLCKKLKRTQKALARKQKGSNNRKKARVQVAKVYAQIADARKYFLHKLTTQILRENQTIVVEDLAIKNMMIGNPRTLRSGWMSIAAPQHLLSVTLRQPQSDTNKKMIITYLIKSQGYWGENINFSICFNISILRC